MVLSKRRGQEQLDMIVSHLQPSLDRLNKLCQRFENISQALAESEGRVGSSKAQPLARPPTYDNVHYTGAHHLINHWPAVQHLLKTAKLDISEDYVLRAEESVPPSYIQSCEERLGAGPIPDVSQQFSDRHPIQSAHIDSIYQAGLEHVDLPSQNVLNLPEGHWRQDLVMSYVEHMHILHPILDLAHLDRLSSRFSRRTPACQPNLETLSGQDGGCIPSQYRKRTLGSTIGRSHTPSGGEKPTVSKSHPLEDAIMLLVLAIGSICAEKAGRPQWAMEILRLPSDSAHELHACGLSKHNHAYAPRPIISRSSSSSSVLHDSESRQECSPGLLYYLAATRILGPWIDRNHLLGAQAFILAGLYKAQLGKVYESMNWITTAGRVCQVLLRQYGLLTPRCTDMQIVDSKLSKEMQSRVKGPVHNLILLCTWTTIQLESDILAELPLVPSGIQAHEDLIPWPTSIPGATAYDAVLGRGPEHPHNVDDILLYYSSQLWLRKRLNQIQKDLYGNACLSMSSVLVKMVLEGHRDVLRAWREELPRSLQWDDDEPPSEDILAARLRAKYLGACFIANRPFLDFVTHILPGLKRGQTLESLAVTSNGEPRSPAKIGILKAISTMPEAQMWEAAEECITVAAKSTRAFDGIPRQLILTNVHGTAHA